MKIQTLFYVALATTLSLPALAQSSKPSTTAPAATVSPSHLQAAEAMVGLVASADTYNNAIDQMLAIQIKQNPSIKKVEPEMRAFFNKYMGWNVMRPELAAVYAREFTEPELREIIKFYQTPVGQKLSARMPELMKAGIEISQRRVQEHLPELEKAIKDKLATEN